MNDNRSRCASCRKPLRAQKAGQRRLYCSSPCKRLAFYKLRRVQKRLVRLEKKLDNLRLYRDFGGDTGSEERRIRRLIREAESQLRALVTPELRKKIRRPNVLLAPATEQAQHSERRRFR